jgi:aspartate racemase
MGKDQEVADLLSLEMEKLKMFGVDFIAIACNTVHQFLNAHPNEQDIPFIHICSGTTEELRKNNIQRVGILGTKYTIQNGIYTNYLNPFSIDTISPTPNEVEIINKAIYHLCSNSDLANDSIALEKIMNNLIKRGAQAIILGCTELSLIINQKDLQVPILDSAFIHAQQLAKLSLETDTALKAQYKYKNGQIQNNKYQWQNSHG